MFGFNTILFGLLVSSVTAQQCRNDYCYAQVCRHTSVERCNDMNFTERYQVAGRGREAVTDCASFLRNTVTLCGG